MSRRWIVRPALLSDRLAVAQLMNRATVLHRHLDWREPIEWLDQTPFLVLEADHLLHAALACPPDPPKIAWLRLFACDDTIPTEDAWSLLWEKAKAILDYTSVSTAAAIALNDSLPPLLERSHFSSDQEIILLEFEQFQPIETSLDPEWTIRPMKIHDLPDVASLDANAFEPLWQTSLEMFRWAFRLSTYATVAEQNGTILGYQLSMRSVFSVHLARLAVLPEKQGQGIGLALTLDMMKRAQESGLYRFTVNTQNDNTASLKLYKRLGFRETGERYPVYRYSFAAKE
ncbi:MAG: GNAT family N-acetyltransferase [Anaerolineales bacterium]|nr:GNAT family N-acetyltransferase [Anaerolineales bacterium]MCX7608577.1 GNAT family N-acetyltransferase [Anaerolineales bacterium]MDW8226411.1 GNAT family N-acetyltransferase [Anaerolineales bacterium]